MRDEWGTPQEFFDALDSLFHFTLDAAATKDNAKCRSYFTKETDGLCPSWIPEIVFCNPPYSGRNLEKWTKKMLFEARHPRVTVVGLILPSTDTTWWHNHVLKADVVVFVRGRISFTPPHGIKARSGNPRGSALVIYNNPVALKDLAQFGAVWGLKRACDERS